MVKNEHSSPGDLDQLYKDYCRYVAAILLRIGGRRGELEDSIQDVFAEATAGIAQVRQPEAIRGWLATIAVRVARRTLRRRRLARLIGLTPSTSEYESLADPAASPFDRALLARLYRALDRLPVDDRVAYVLHHVEGETLDAVAALCGCSGTTAKRRILRARLALEELLADD
ncbi:MAG TPA: sigma-70 family RNA polymerase sigma factor [Polyangiaceae bacterium]|nr:sigma-70 family RNA polymerase sigma factor [Polyangiaceae bacterium]